jgi:hypothetical protein
MYRRQDTHHESVKICRFHMKNVFLGNTSPPARGEGGRGNPEVDLPPKVRQLCRDAFCKIDSIEESLTSVK